MIDNNNINNIINNENDDLVIEFSDMKLNDLSKQFVNNNNKKNNNNNNTTEKVCIGINGMTCSACSGTIENALRQTNGVISANVSLMTNQAEVVFNSNVINIDQIIEEIEDVGFDAVYKEAIENGEVYISTCNLLSPETVHAVNHRILLIDGVRSSTAITQRLENNDNHCHRFKITYDIKLTGLRTIKTVFQHYKIPTQQITTAGDLHERQEILFKQRQDELNDWKISFWRSMSFTLPIIVLAMICPHINALDQTLKTSMIGSFTLHTCLLWILVTPVQFGIGKRFFISAIKSIRHGSASMDVLIAIGSLSAYLYSSLVSILACTDPSYKTSAFFETSAFLISIVLLGRYLESYVKGRTSESLSKLMSLQPTTACLLNIDDNDNILGEEEIDVSFLQYNDVVKVTRGQTIPLDGIIIYGTSSVDESLVTGEALPVSKTIGSKVIGATLNMDSTIHIKVTGVGAESVLYQIVKLVEEAQSNKAPIQAFADNVSSKFVPVVVSISFLTFICWYIGLKYNLITLSNNYHHNSDDTFLFSFLLAISVIVVSCPCALGLATPTAVMVGTGVGARLGVLFKGGTPLENCGKTTAVLFDKTGSLTVGKPSINDNEVYVNNDAPPNMWLWIAAIEKESEHILGKAIYQYSMNIIKENKLLSNDDTKLPNVEHFKAKNGAGVKGIVQGHNIILGNRLWLTTNQILITQSINDTMSEIENLGHIAICVAVDNEIAAVLSLYDKPKEEANFVINCLREENIKVYMVTGDNHRTARYVAQGLGIDSDCVMAEILPTGKAEVVKRLQRNHESVVFVGDGINDSPALAQATVGIAIGKGTDIAIETASIVLMRDDLRDVLTAIDLSRVVLNRIRLNFMWAIIYNVIMIPLAAGIFIPHFNFSLPPVASAVSMGFSSISVVLSSLMLRYYKKPNYDEMSTNDSRSKPSRASRVWKNLRRRLTTRKGYDRLPTKDTVIEAEVEPENNTIFLINSSDDDDLYY